MPNELPISLRLAERLPPENVGRSSFAVTPEQLAEFQTLLADFAYDLERRGQESAAQTANALANWIQSHASGFGVPESEWLILHGVTRLSTPPSGPAG